MAKTTSKTLFGEPAGLTHLALTEAWERFSCYGMSALVMLYVTETLPRPEHAARVAGLASLRSALGWLTGAMSNQAFASIIHGLYSGLVCFTPLLGGLLAHRLLGARATVVIGALPLSAGHLALAFDATFLIGLALLILACGCVKGDIAAQIGGLLASGDEAARTWALTLFNMGINTGAVAGPIVCGLLAQVWGWHAGFAAAGVIMLLGLVTYLSGPRHDPPQVLRREASAAARRLSPEEWRVIALLSTAVAVTIFQSVAYFQIGNAGMIRVRGMVDPRTPLGAAPAAWFRSVDSLTSVVLATPMIAPWRWRERRGGLVGDYAKLGYGAAITAALAGLLALACYVAGPTRVGMDWSIAAFAGMGLGFLYYWPTLMALVSRRAPAGTTGVMLGVIFLSLFVAKIAMGWIGGLYETMSPAAFWGLDALITAAGAALIAMLWYPLASRLGEVVVQT